MMNLTKLQMARWYEDSGRLHLTDRQFGACVSPADDEIKLCTENTPFATATQIVKENIDTTFLPVNFTLEVYPSNFAELCLEENEVLLMTGVDGTNESRNHIAEAIDLLTTKIFHESKRLFDKKLPGQTRENPRVLTQVWFQEKMDEDGNYLVSTDGSSIENHRELSNEKIFSFLFNKGRVDEDENGVQNEDEVENNGMAKFTLQWFLVDKLIEDKGEVQYPVLSISVEIDRAPFIGPLRQNEIPNKLPYTSSEIKAFYEGKAGLLAALERSIFEDVEERNERFSVAFLVECLALHVNSGSHLHNPQLLLEFLIKQDLELHLLNAMNRDQQVTNLIVATSGSHRSANLSGNIRASDATTTHKAAMESQKILALLHEAIVPYLPSKKRKVDSEKIDDFN